MEFINNNPPTGYNRLPSLPPIHDEPLPQYPHTGSTPTKFLTDLLYKYISIVKIH